MKAPVYIYTGTDETSRYVLVRGRVQDLLHRNRIPAMRSRGDRGWWLRRERLSDFLCLLQVEHFEVHVVAGDPR